MKSREQSSGRVIFFLALVSPALWFLPALLFHRAPSFRDQGDFFYPLKLYTADRLRRGEIPLWNPLSGAGEPWLANLQSGVFYPPTALFFLPSPALAAALYLILHFWIGAWGLWRFLKEEGVSDAGALLGAGFFSSSGFTASLAMYWNHFGAWAYLPGIAALARSGLRTRASRLGMALLIGLAAMAGSPEILAVNLFLGALLAWKPRRQEGGWLDAPVSRRLARFALAAGLGLALAAWALVPFGELLLHSERRIGLSALQRDAGAVHAEALLSALGLSTGVSGTSYLATLYIGPAILLCAGAAFAESQRRPLLALLAAVAAGGILFALAPPPGAWLRAVPPFDLVRYPAKALSFTFFSVSVLAGIGIDALRFGSARKGKLPILLACLAGLPVAFFSRSDFVSRYLSAAAVFLIGALALLAGRIPKAGGLLSGLAAVAALAGLCLSSREIFQFAPESELRSETDPVRFLARVPGRVLTPPMTALAAWVLREGRFDAETLRRQREALLGYTNLIAGVRTVRTAAALETRGGAILARSIDDAADLSRAAGAASARVLWTPFLPPNMGSRKVGDFFRAPISPYRPRLSFAGSYRVEPDAESAWRRASGGESDPSREVFLDRPPQQRLAGGAGKPLLLARVSEDSPERVVAEVTSNQPGLLILTDLSFPGWTAQTDGKTSALLKADGLFRAVAIDAGSHRVVFRYRPMSFLVGVAITLAAAATLLGASWLARPAHERSLL